MCFKKTDTRRDNVDVITAIGYTAAETAADAYFWQNPKAREVWVSAFDGKSMVEVLVVNLER